MNKTFFQYFIECITTKYATFSGRASRTEFWSFILFNAILSILLRIIANVLDLDILLYLGLSLFISLVLFIPNLAVAVRRVHDTGHSGWFILLPVYNIILFFTSGDTGSNEYGPNPKNSALEIEIDQIGK